MRNFLSTGNITQTVELDRAGMTLVLGENQDLGGNGNRNGVGKTSLVHAISFALYGQALSTIKRDNLVNRINGKNMSVAIEFNIGAHRYRIERGRKPHFFRYFVDDTTVNSPDTDEAQGENRETQKQIDSVLGMSHNMFRNIVALNTYTEPFLSQGAGKQRELIEELLLITMLSTKAEALKERIRNTKISYDQEEIRLKTVRASNDRIQQSLIDLKKRLNKWDIDHNNKLIELRSALEELTKLDVEAEIQSHRDLQDIAVLNRALSDHQRHLISKKRHFQQLEAQLVTISKNHSLASNNECPTCKQGITDHNHKTIISDLEKQLVTLDQQRTPIEAEIKNHQSQIVELTAAIATYDTPNIFYQDLEQSLDHRNSVDRLQTEILRMEQEINPYISQELSLNTTMQEVNNVQLDELASQKEHEEFLYKLLTNKDSFIRKKIVDQNLAYMNIRLQDYLTKLGLPHQVKFMNDLSVDINHLGIDTDFDSCSRGERTRVILALSWAFRDIWENNNQPINLIFVDELLDAGLDSMGLEKSVEILKVFGRDRSKNVMLISHRDELSSRVSQILAVIKADGFTKFDWDWEW